MRKKRDSSTENRDECRAEIIPFPVQESSHHVPLSPAVHIVDKWGLILESTINASNSITGEDIIGTYAADHIHPEESLIYIDRIERTIKKGLEFCTFRLNNELWLAKMERISSHRVRITETCIEGMGIAEVLSIL